MLDFSLPTDFGGVAADLDFSLSDVTIQSRDDGIENERYLRPKIYENTLGMVDMASGSGRGGNGGHRKTTKGNTKAKKRGQSRKKKNKKKKQTALYDDLPF